MNWMPPTITAWPAQTQTQSPAGPSSPPAHPGPFRALQEHWGSSNVVPVEWIMVAAGLLLLLVGLLAAYRWWRTRHLRPQPVLVFLQVARTAGLGLRDQWLLWRIAKQAALPSPLTLLLSPRTLRHHAHEYAERKPPRRRMAIMQRIASIRRTLVGPAAD